jgi:hypothetical protein
VLGIWIWSAATATFGHSREGIYTQNISQASQSWQLVSIYSCIPTQRSSVSNIGLVSYINLEFQKYFLPDGSIEGIWYFINRINVTPKIPSLKNASNKVRI